MPVVRSAVDRPARQVHVLEQPFVLEANVVFHRRVPRLSLLGCHHEPERWDVVSLEGLEGHLPPGSRSLARKPCRSRSPTRRSCNQSGRWPDWTPGYGLGSSRPESASNSQPPETTPPRPTPLPTIP